jgi:hyperosmotically inducible periplasmic protein
MKTRTLIASPLLALAAAALALTGCNRGGDTTTAGEKIDAATAKTESAMNSAANKVENAADRAGAKMDDAGITAKVNAELAKDPALSALKIDVDTSNGRVVLRGSAPDAAARDRATQLASTVQGVSAVDNQLEVRG